MGSPPQFLRRPGQPHLSPVPRFDTLTELNAYIARSDDADDGRHISSRKSTVGADFAIEAKSLGALPFDDFDTSRLLNCRVDSKARICVRLNHYSVPARFAGKRLTVKLSADGVMVLDATNSVVATHPRSVHRGEEIYVLDHYLEVLQRKPGALAGSTALEQARRNGLFTAAHDEFWSEARRKLGDGPGTRALIEVLLLHRHLEARAVVGAITKALEVGCIDSAVVAIEARQMLAPKRDAVVPIERANDFDRPVPSINSYDELLEATK